VLPVQDKEIKRAQITTRDIDRGALPALPAQGDLRGAGVVQKTLRGKIREEDGSCA
jgi:hypothetical protein